MNTAVTTEIPDALTGAATASRLTRQRVRSAWMFLAPMLLVLVLVAGWPLARTIWFGFTDANLSDLEGAEFVGFLNYQYLLTDPEWWNAVWNTFVFASISVTLETVLGLGIALALDAHFQGPGSAARSRADPLGDSDRGLGPDVGLDVPRRVRRDQRGPARILGIISRADRLDRLTRIPR